MELDALQIIKKNKDMHGRTIGKVRRKELEKQEKMEKSVYRAHYCLISKPPKFINPYKMYRLYTDHPLIEDNGKFYSCMSALPQWKYVSTVNINHKLGVVSVIYENNTNYLTPTWQYIAERMKSMGDSEANEWAGALETFSGSYENIRKTNQLECYLLNRATIDPSHSIAIVKAKEYILNNTLVWAFKYNFASAEGEICSVGYNHLLSRALGYKTLDELSDALKQQSYVKTFNTKRSSDVGYKLYMKSVYTMGRGPLLIDLPDMLITKNKMLLPVLITNYMFASRNEKKEPELELYCSMKIGGAPMPADESEDLDKPMTPEYFLQQKKEAKELDEFLELYYGNKERNNKPEELTATYRVF
jgi:hypothetical protein